MAPMTMFNFSYVVGLLLVYSSRQYDSTGCGMFSCGIWSFRDLSSGKISTGSAPYFESPCHEMTCMSRSKLSAGNILNCLEQDKWNARHPSHLTKRFITEGLSAAQCMHSRDIRGHHGCVNAVEFSNSEEELLITGGDDRRVLLWRVCELIEGKSRSVAMESIHESNIFSLAFSSDNAFAYSAGNDGMIKKHDIWSTKCLLQHTNEDIPAIYCLSAHPFSPDVVLSASDDGSVSVIDTRVPPGPANTILVQSTSSYQSACFNPVEPNLVAVGHSSLGAALYDTRMKQKLFSYDPTWYSLHQQDVVSVSFDWSGTRLLTLQRKLPPTVFSIWENKALYQLVDNNGTYRNSVTMKSGCFLGHNDEYVASGSDDFRCYIWKIPHGGTIKKGRGTTVLPHLVLPGHRSIVNQVRYSAVHHVMCSSGVEKIFKLWSHLPLAPNDKLQWSGDLPPRPRFSHLELLDTEEEGGDDSDEDHHVLAFFDALVEQDEMLITTPDSSSTDEMPSGDSHLDSSSPPTHGGDFPFSFLVSSDSDDQEIFAGQFLGRHSSCSCVTTSNLSSPANTSSLEPPWSDQSLSGCEICDDSDGGSDGDDGGDGGSDGGSDGGDGGSDGGDGGSDGGDGSGSTDGDEDRVGRQSHLLVETPLDDVTEGAEGAEPPALNSEAVHKSS